MSNRIRPAKNDNVGHSFYSPASPLPANAAETAHQTSVDGGICPPSALAEVVQSIFVLRTRHYLVGPCLFGKPQMYTLKEPAPFRFPVQPFSIRFVFYFFV